jgi:hypothetical protein
MDCRLDIHNHILPRDWPDLKQVQYTYTLCRMLGSTTTWENSGAKIEHRFTRFQVILVAFLNLFITLNHAVLASDTGPVLLSELVKLSSTVIKILKRRHFASSSI